MLDKVESAFFEEFQAILDENMLLAQNPNPHDTLLHVFSFLKVNQTLAKALIGPHGNLSFISKLKDLVKDRIHFVWTKEQMKQKNFEYYCTFIIFGLIGLIENWLNHDCDRTVEEMAEMSGI